MLLIDWLKDRHAENPYFPLAFCVLCAPILAGVLWLGAWIGSRLPGSAARRR